MSGERKIEPGACRVGTEPRMKWRGDGVVAAATNVMAVRDTVILQPQGLQQARGTAETRVDLEVDVMVAKEAIWDERNAWKGRCIGEDRR